MNAYDLFLKLSNKEKDIYENATLFEQNRRNINDYIHLLCDPISGKNLEIINDTLQSDSLNYSCKDNIANFSKQNTHSAEWEILNKQFLNYHKSLTVHEYINSISLINYISYHSEIGLSKNIRVLDVGGGTGHSYCSFFQFPETIEYFLLDPNVRLLHDHFLRIYPKLSLLEMAHIIANAEHLPIKDETFDLVMSFASIDHMDNYKVFIKEAKRVLKVGGTFFVSTHIDNIENNNPKKSKFAKLLKKNLGERIVRYLYYRKNKVGADDHTIHLYNEIPIEDEILLNGFSISKKHVFEGHFYIIAKKI